MTSRTVDTTGTASALDELMPMGTVAPRACPRMLAAAACMVCATDRALRFAQPSVVLPTRAVSELPGAFT